VAKKSVYKLDPRNARKHPDKNKQAVNASLKELGAGRSIVVDADGVVIGGNAVYEQAKALGIPVKEIESSGDELVVVRRVDLKTDDPRRKALALADNKISDISEFDWERVAEQLQEITETIDFETMGFEEFEVKPLLAGDFNPGDVGDLGGERKDKEEKTVICPKCGHEFTP
jgi:stage V sporulation protein SpoVS